MNYKMGLGNKDSLFFVALNLALTLLIVFLLTSISFKIQEAENIGLGRNITVSGEAEISAEPGLALMNIVLIDRSQNIDEAINQSVGKMKSVIGIITILGIEKEDIKTVLFDISPVQQAQFEDGVSYEVKRYLEVKIKEVDKVGGIIKGVLANNIDGIESLNFFVDNQEELKDQVRKMAIDNAQAKSVKVSEQLGVNLIKIINFSENFTVPQFATKENLESLETFYNELSLGKMKATVNITYQIK